MKMIQSTQSGSATQVTCLVAGVITLILGNSANAADPTNTQLGGQAAAKLTTGVSNTAAGFQALFKDKTGSFNVAVGDGALFNLTSGNNNIAIGVDAGAKVKTGNDNIYLDHPGFAKESGAIRIGIPGTHKTTYLSGVVKGNGSKLKNVRVKGSNITGTIPASKFQAGSLPASVLSPNLSLGGTTSGTFSGNLNGTASNAVNAMNAATATNAVNAASAANATNATNAANAANAAKIDQATVKLKTASVATLGGAAGFSFNSGIAGLLLETSEPNESAGMFLNGNTCVIYSPGDNDILKVYDEDAMSGLLPVPAFRVLNANLGTTTPGTSVSRTGIAPGGVEQLKIIRGRVFLAGTVGGGSGYTVSKAGTGNYAITFTSAFAGVPVVTATAVEAGGPEIVTLGNINSLGVTVRVWTLGGAASDSDFHFTAIGN